jgi:hypothetical protein
LILLGAQRIAKIFAIYVDTARFEVQYSLIATPTQEKEMQIDHRQIVAAVIAPVLAITGFRFTKDYRWGVTAYHRTVYAIVGTVWANIYADRLAYAFRRIA